MSFTTRFGVDPTLETELANKRYVDDQITLRSINQILIKQATESKTNDNTFADDDTLFYTGRVGKKYIIWLVIRQDSPTTEDFKWRLTIPSGATAIKTSGIWSGAAGGNAWSADATTSKILNGTNSEDFHTQLIIVDMLAASAGTISLQWAQQVSGAGASEMLKGAFMLVWEV